MNPSQLTRISKFLSLILRHHPEKIGLALDEHGWVEVDDLLLKARRAGLALDRPVLEQVVEQNDKKRFAFSPDGQKIRASQGHSVPVDLGLQAAVPPETLYHGSALRFRESILAAGLLPGQRRHVHLSDDWPTALAVGRRHGQPVVFEVQAGRMNRDGYAFYRSANGVWLTGAVPARYLVLLEEVNNS